VLRVQAVEVQVLEAVQVAQAVLVAAVRVQTLAQ
jgi:hypothetical protein